MPTWNNPGPQDFDAALEPAGSSGGCAVTVPLDVLALYGVKGRVPVVAKIDGVDYRGSIAPYGGSHRLGVLKSIREQLGKQPGDSVHIRLELDDQQRTVSLDTDVEQTLSEAGQLEKFKAMSFTHQREFVDWIASAKRESTRADRLAKLVDMVAAR